jgi:NAD(P)-dependent dehydrogenase (short-subunit alcohol dehydrogenase family)
MQQKTVVITGATSGIGLVTAESLAEMGAELILVGRNRVKGETVVNRLRARTGNTKLAFHTADLSSLGAVREIAEEINQRVDKIDVLINNAGAIFMNRQVTIDGFEMTLALNHLSPFLLTHLLLEKIKSAPVSRIVTVSSRAHLFGRMNFDDLMSERRYSPWQVYGSTKLANILFTYHLANVLKDTSVTANALEPGFVRTNFARSNGGIHKFFMTLVMVLAKSPEVGARTSIFLASSPDVEGTTGKYFANCKAAESSPASYNEVDAARLWEVSLKLTGLKPE